MFRFSSKPKPKYIECGGPGPHSTKSGSRWLVDGLHSYVKIEDGTYRCQKCVNKGRPREQQQGFKRPPPQCEVSKQHDRIGLIWGIQRTRRRTEWYSGSDMWTCLKCGKRGDFYFFEGTDCRKQMEEDITGPNRGVPIDEEQTTLE